MMTTCCSVVSRATERSCGMSILSWFQPVYLDILCPYDFKAFQRVKQGRLQTVVLNVAI